MIDDTNLNKTLKTLSYIAGIVLIYITISYLSVYLFPFVLALVVAYIVNPYIEFIQFKLKFKNRVVSVLSFLIFSFTLIISLFLLVGPYIINEVNSSLELIYNFIEKNSHTPNTLTYILVNKFKDFFSLDVIQGLINQSNIEKYGEDLLSLVWNSFVKIYGIIDSLFITITFLLYLLFTLIYYNEFEKNISRYIPPIYRENAIILFSELESSMKVYFRGQSKIVFVLCILFSIAFKIIGLPLAIPLGILTGLVNFVPYLQLAMIPPALILMSIRSIETSDPIWLSIVLVLSAFSIVQLIQDTILVPKIMGDETGLNPAIILLSLSIFGGLFGLVGMIVALPLTTVIIKYYEKYILKEI